MSGSYAVSVRGPVPPDLARKIASAHAEAVARRSASVSGRPQVVAQI